MKIIESIQEAMGDRAAAFGEIRSILAKRPVVLADLNREVFVTSFKDGGWDYLKDVVSPYAAEILSRLNGVESWVGESGIFFISNISNNMDLEGALYNAMVMNSPGQRKYRSRAGYSASSLEALLEMMKSDYEKISIRASGGNVTIQGHYGESRKQDYLLARVKPLAVKDGRITQKEITWLKANA